MKMRMDQATFDEFYKLGCDPTCHICRAAIGVGSDYNMRVLLSNLRGEETGTVEMMTCAGCMVEPTPEAEMRKAREHLLREKQAEREREVYRASHPGCLVVNGQVFPGVG